MPRDPIRLADAKAWLAKADMDLKAAAHELTAAPPFTADAVFHAQQAAEKAIKGFLAWQTIRPSRVTLYQRSWTFSFRTFRQRRPCWSLLAA
jgi:HEPN domain-containing protein